MKAGVAIIGAGWLGQLLATYCHHQGISVVTTRRTVDAAQTKTPQPLDASNQALAWALPQPPTADVANCLRGRAWVVCIPPALHRDGGEGYLASLRQIVSSADMLDCSRLILCSSTGIYAGLTGDVDESTAIRATSPRTSVLRAAELLVQQARQHHILRLAGLTGPGRHPRQFCARGVMSGAELPVNLVHAHDICRYVVGLLQGQWQLSLTNLVCPDHPSKQQFYGELAKTHLPVPLQFTEADEPMRIVRSHVEQQTSFRFQIRTLVQLVALCNSDIKTL